MPPQVETEAAEIDMQQEYMRQREYLERNLAALKKKVVKDREIHQAAHLHIIQVINLFLVVCRGKKEAAAQESLQQPYHYGFFVTVLVCFLARNS